MFNTNDILTRLQNGEDAQKIADEMARALNEANDKYRAIQEKAKAEAEKVKIQEKKRSDMNEILDLFKVYINTYHPGLLKETTDLSIDEVIEGLDSIMEAFATLTDLSKMVEKPIVQPKKTCKSATPDDILNTFLKEMGL